MKQETAKQHVELINDNIEEFDKAIELFKQETLEEVALRLYPEEWDWKEREIFIKGAKYQAERSYSEEDMKSFADWCRNGLLNTEYSVDRLNEHLEQWKQFKKK
jgi:hypothetical protein